MRRTVSISIVLCLFCAAALTTAAQAGGEPYWFYAKADLAKRKVIPVSELRACMLGDTFKPSVSGKFKAEVSSTGGNRSRLLESGMCDVALAFNDGPEGLDRVKRDFAGFAIYKIAGNNLELVVEPTTSGWIGVGRMELSSQQTLDKKNVSACGDGPLRELFRPSPKVWKNWSQAYVKFEDLKTPKQLEQENVLLYGCEVWIFTPDDYKRYSAKYGTKNPTFDVKPGSPVLTRIK